MKKFSKILIIVNLVIGYILSAFMTGMLATEGLFGSGVFDEITKGTLSGRAEALIFFLVVGLLCFIVLNLIYIPIYIIKLLLLSKDTINTRYVDTKESVYTRDLPEYNAAVAGEIVDLKTTFEEEYLAGVIELIEKGYIIENENELIIDTSKSTESLLKNEKYILKTCTNLMPNLRVISNYEFYKELKEDMYDLGLYKRGVFLKELKNKISYYMEKDRKGEVKTQHYILIMMLPMLVSLIMQNILVMIILYLIILVLIRKNKLTEKGELEKEKMSKLKLFLQKETDFKNKGEEERQLWGRYSAFAVAFGINTEMREEIQNKIIKKV